jgi:hypothetical protein
MTFCEISTPRVPGRRRPRCHWQAPDTIVQEEPERAVERTYAGLQNRGGVRRKRREALLRNGGLRPSFHPTKLAPAAPLVLGTPQKVMLSSGIGEAGPEHSFHQSHRIGEALLSEETNAVDMTTHGPTSVTGWAVSLARPGRRCRSRCCTRRRCTADR